MQVIEVRGVEYKLVKARDFEVIVRSDNGFINYTKLCQQINDNRRPFKELKKSETFKRLCIQMENSSERIRSEQPDVEIYEQIKDRVEIEVGGRKQDPEIARISGTYMPRYLLDYVIMTCDIGYYKLVHELMDSIDRVAQERQRSFIEELQSNISEQNRKLERKKLKISRLDQLCNDLRESNANLDNQMREVRTQNAQLLERNDQVIAQNNQLLEDNRETHHQLDETHRLLNNANHKLDNIGHQINSLSETFTNNFSEMNMTTGTAEYTYIVLSIPSLTREMISNQSIPSNYAVFDSICCLKKDRQKQLASHYFNPDTDVIELEYECSCSLDISKFITTNFSKAYCYNFNSSDYRRKIVYATNRKDNIIEKIRKYLARSERNKFSIIERLDRLQETVNNIETRVSSIEDFFMYLRHKGTFVIDGKTIRRVLNRDLYHNLYINLDGSRHTLTLDELNNATFE